MLASKNKGMLVGRFSHQKVHSGYLFVSTSPERGFLSL